MAGLQNQEHELTGLARDMSTYLTESRSSSTNSKYLGYFRRFKDFMISHGKSYLPCTGINLSLFLVSLLNKNSTFSVLSSYVHAVKYVHGLHCMQDPTVHPCVRNLLESSKRRNVRGRGKKDPVSSSHIRQLFVKYISSTDLLVVRDLCIIVVCFSAFLRYDEVSNLKCNDVEFHVDYMSLYIRKSKTDQYRSGNRVLVAKLDTVACPVGAVQRYIRLASIDLNSSHFLFKPMYRRGNVTGLIKSDKKLSYTRAKETIVSRLSEVASDLNLGLHSLRAGGATAAANSDVNDRCWKRHGRWRTDSAKDGYVQESVSNRLSVSKSLGL